MVSGVTNSKKLGWKPVCGYWHKMENKEKAKKGVSFCDSSGSQKQLYFVFVILSITAVMKISY
jgi:hypothetical protein